MSKQLLGKEVNVSLNERIKAAAQSLKDRGVEPCLGIIRVGEREDDLSYERGATKRCETLGVAYRKYVLPADVAEETPQRMWTVSRIYPWPECSPVRIRDMHPALLPR